MRFTTITSLAALSSVAFAAPYYPFPLQDGFPTPNSDQLSQIQKTAGGSLPTKPLPGFLKPDGVVTTSLIALNEIFEVAFFTSLISNITDGVKGYELDGYNKTYVLAALTAIQKQEELHYLGANAILANANQETVKPCKYKFPVTSFKSAITLANTFTDVVLGVLPQAQTVFATDGGEEIGLVELLGSIIAQEAEQNGYYRSLQSKLPSAAPFLTTEGPAFAYTFLLNTIIPGSCPNLYLVSDHVPSFAPLNVLSKPPASTSTVKYSVPGKVSASSNSIVYISGQNLPVTVSISDVENNNGVTTFSAELPFDSGFAKGLTIATVVKGTGKKFATANEVAAATAFGPGIIEIQ